MRLRISAKCLNKAHILSTHVHPADEISQLCKKIYAKMQGGIKYRLFASEKPVLLLNKRILKILFFSSGSFLHGALILAAVVKGLYFRHGKSDLIGRVRKVVTKGKRDIG